MWSLEPQIPWSLWWALAVVAALGWGYYAVNRSSGLSFRMHLLVVSLMAVSILLPLLLLLNPTWIEPILPPAGTPVMTVLVDATESMLTEDVAESGSSDVSRWEAAWLAAQRLILDSAKCELRLLRFSDQLAPLDEMMRLPNGNRTDLATAIQQAISTDRPQGQAVTVFSDGAHNVGANSQLLAVAASARALNVPIFTIPLGGPSDARNIAISVRNPQLMSFPTRPVTVRVELSQRGYNGHNCLVTLSNTEGELETKRVELRQDGLTEVTFPLRVEQAGLYRYRIDVEGAAGEATLADNQTSCQLQVIDQPIQVLLLEGKPYWDTKFLARNLAADPAVELTSVVRIGDNRFMQRTDPAQLTSNAAGENLGGPSEAASLGWKLIRGSNDGWTSTQGIEAYRIVVLGRSTEVFLDEAAVDRLRGWVSRQGGALVCSRGNPSTQLSQRLSQILPVRWQSQTRGEQRVRGRLTSLGQSAAIISSEDAQSLADPLPSLPSLALGSLPAATVGLPQILVRSELTADGQSVPLVTHQRYGSGQTVVVEGAGMWRWAFLPPEQAENQRVYAELWQGLIQCLISQQELLPGQQVALRTDRVAYVTGEQASATLLIRAAATTDDANSGRLAELLERPPAVLLRGAALDLPKRFEPMPLGDEAGVFRIHFGDLPPGHYTAQLADWDPQQPGGQTEFDVRDPWYERLDVDAQPGLLREVAERSGGRMFALQDAGEAMKAFQNYLEDSRPPQVRRSTLWDRPAVMLLCLVIWSACWYTRRRFGLV